jgi:hypothetical protein
VPQSGKSAELPGEVLLKWGPLIGETFPFDVLHVLFGDGEPRRHIGARSHNCQTSVLSLNERAEDVLAAVEWNGGILLI